MSENETKDSCCESQVNPSRKRSALEADLIDVIPTKKIRKLDNNNNNSNNDNNNDNMEMKDCNYDGLDAYEKQTLLGRGTYGIVYMARDRRTNETVALKQLNHSQSSDSNTNNNFGFPITSIREITILQTLKHANIVNLREVVRSENLGYVFLVLDYYKHDLSSIIDKRIINAFSLCEIKCILLQILHGLRYAHRHFVIHRDIKLSNILMNDKGDIVICDWGLARFHSHPITENDNLTPKVVTLWYRAPELLFGDDVYHSAIDVWSVGCIFAELLQQKALFESNNECEHLHRICELLGAPNNTVWNGYSRLKNVENGSLDDAMRSIEKKNWKYSQLECIFGKWGWFCLDLIKLLLAYDPSKRITANQAINHPFFKEHPSPASKDTLPKFP